METYLCPIHHIELEKGVQACPQCLEDFANLPDPETMSGDERAAETYRWRETLRPLPIPVDVLIRRYDALVGREVFTHELSSSNADAIANEARTRKHPEYIEDTVPPELRDKMIYFDAQDTMSSES